MSNLINKSGGSDNEPVDATCPECESENVMGSAIGASCDGRSVWCVECGYGWWLS